MRETDLFSCYKLKICEHVCGEICADPTGRLQSQTCKSVSDELIHHLPHTLQEFQSGAKYNFTLTNYGPVCLAKVLAHLHFSQVPVSADYHNQLVVVWDLMGHTTLEKADSLSTQHWRSSHTLLRVCVSPHTLLRVCVSPHTLLRVCVGPHTLLRGSVGPK